MTSAPAPSQGPAQLAPDADLRGADGFAWRGDVLHADQVSLETLAATHGTPLYVYAARPIRTALGRLTAAFGSAPHVVAYSVKANPCLAVVALLARAGAGADVVSRGELARALKAGVPASKVVFAGTGKREDELAAGLDAGVLVFNVEVDDELEHLSRLARQRGVTASIGLRVNPDTDAGTHHYIATGKKVNKFGVPWERAREVLRKAASLPNLRVRGLDCHIGSQLTSLGPVAEALARMRGLFLELRAEGLPLDLLDVGGGLGVTYTDEAPPAVEDYARTVLAATSDLGALLVVEPGRSLVARAGVLLTRVLYRKEQRGRRFLVVDAGMNDLLRPALYQAKHGLAPVRRGGGTITAEVVGPLCETGDFLVAERELPDAKPGDLLAVLTCGAYARSMASNYNTRPRAAEVLVDGERSWCVTRRETVDELLERESIPW